MLYELLHDELSEILNDLAFDLNCNPADDETYTKLLRARMKFVQFSLIRRNIT